MMRIQSRKFRNDQAGTLLIELAFVVGILAMAAMVGLEIAHFLQRSQSGVSLTRELSNSILRECYDACDTTVATNSNSPTRICIEEELSRVARIARGVDAAMRVRTTVLVRNVDAECMFQTTPTAWKTFSASSSNRNFNSPKATVSQNLVNNIRNSTQPQQQGIVVLAEVEARYSPLTGFALSVFGRDKFYYHGTIM